MSEFKDLLLTETSLFQLRDTRVDILCFLEKFLDRVSPRVKGWEKTYAIDIRVSPPFKQKCHSAASENNGNGFIQSKLIRCQIKTEADIQEPLFLFMSAITNFTHTTVGTVQQTKETHICLHTRFCKLINLLTLFLLFYAGHMHGCVYEGQSGQM